MSAKLANTQRRRHDIQLTVYALRFLLLFVSNKKTYHPVEETFRDKVLVRVECTLGKINLKLYAPVCSPGYEPQPEARRCNTVAGASLPIRTSIAEPVNAVRTCDVRPRLACVTEESSRDRRDHFRAEHNSNACLTFFFFFWGRWEC